MNAGDDGLNFAFPIRNFLGARRDRAARSASVRDWRSLAMPETCKIGAGEGEAPPSFYNYEFAARPAQFFTIRRLKFRPELNPGTTGRPCSKKMRGEISGFWIARLAMVASHFEWPAIR